VSAAQEASMRAHLANEVGTVTHSREIWARTGGVRARTEAAEESAPTGAVRSRFAGGDADEEAR
jgi:hypothetical protein